MYKRKTLLELSQFQSYNDETTPLSRRSGMIYTHESESSDEPEKPFISSNLRHRKPPAMELLKQLPSHNKEFDTARWRSTLAVRSCDKRKKRKQESAPSLSNAIMSENEIADKIYQTLKGEIDDDKDVVDAEQFGTSLLREMKHSLTIKRMVKARLASYSHEKPKKVALHKRIGYSFGMMWSKMKNNTREMTKHIKLWHSHIHYIEGNYGSGVVSYFYFLRYLLYLNLLLFILVGFFIILPQELYRFIAEVPFSNVSFTGKELLTGTGWFVNTELYYNFYTNNTIELFTGIVYNMPIAYLLTTSAYFLLMLMSLAYCLASTYKKNFVITSESISRSLPIKVFCGWDHQISSEDAADLKHKSLYNEISCMVASLKKDGVSDDLCIRCGRFFMRLGVNSMILVMMAGTGAVVYFLLDSKSLELQANIPIFGEIVLALTITVIIVLFPLICSTMVEWEEYKSKQVALYLTLIRTFIMQSVILGILTYFWLDISESDFENGCWEAKLGQEIYRLVIFNLIFLLIVTFFTDFVRKILAKCFPSIGLAEFDIATNTLNLIYIQTLCWLGTFFCPLLPLIILFVLVILFYVKRYSTTSNCQPSSKPWKAAHAETVFLSVTLVSFMLTVVALSYIVIMAHPSSKCGPFCHQNSMYSVILSVLHDIVSVDVVGVIINIFTAPAVVGGILLLMCILVYYLRAMAKAHKEMTELLRKQLLLESKDKVFLLRWFETALKNPKSPSKSPTLQHVNETETMHKRMIPSLNVGSIMSGIGQVSSGVTEVGSKVGQSVLKLKNVINPMYRDKSRKDQEMKTDPTDIPPLRTVNTDSNIDEPDGFDTSLIAPRSSLSNEDLIQIPVPESLTSSQQATGSQMRLSSITPVEAMTPDQAKLRKAFHR